MQLHLEYTDDRFVFAGKSYPNVPLLVDSNHNFVEPVCQYLRHLVIQDHLKPSSVKTYAEYILNFWRYIDKENVNFNSVTDYHFHKWLNQLEEKVVSAKTRAARCDAVFNLYVWMEMYGHVSRVIRIPSFNDNEKFTPQLTSVYSKGRGQKLSLVSAVRPRSIRGEVQHTPNFEEVSTIYTVVDKQINLDIKDRNFLLLDWYVQVGLRRSEWALLTIDQIPSWNEIHKIQNMGQSFEFKLTKTKGDRIRHVAVLPDLLEKTREYIEGPRADIVARFFRKNHGAYVDPKYIFLSNKTGNCLNFRSISNALTGWFKESAVDGHGHRLRATYLNNLFDAEITAEELRLAEYPDTKKNIDYELILLKVAERAGHSNVDSLRSYLVLTRKRKARNSNASNHAMLIQQLEIKERELAVIKNKINQLKSSS